MRICIDEQQHELSYQQKGKDVFCGLYSDEAFTIYSKHWVKLLWNRIIEGYDWDSEAAQIRRQQLNNGQGGLEPELVWFFYVLKLVYKKVWARAIIPEYIGHLALNTELHFRRESLETHDITDESMRILYRGMYPVANNQLYKMIKRRANEFVLESHYVFQVLLTLSQNDPEFFDLGKEKHRFFGAHQLQYLDTDFEEWNEIEPQLKFSEDELICGNQLLKQMSVQGEYICMHSRDDAYTDAKYEGGQPFHSFRNCDINNYLMAAEMLAKKNIWALRMGAKSEKRIHSTNGKIIDYSNLCRSEFGDVFLAGTCKFFLGCASGISAVSTAFGVPIVMANVTTMDTPPFLKDDLYIHKKFWSRKKRRFLSYREMVEIGADTWRHAEDFDAAEIEFVENTAEEILDVAVEMNSRIEGTWVAEPEDERLQERYRNLFHANHPARLSPARVGAKYLRDNAYLFE